MTSKQDDNIIDLRKKIKEVIEAGLASEDSIFEGTLINLYNKCKASEDRCKSISHEHAKKVAQADAQASAYSQMSSIVYATLSGFLQVAKRDKLELEAQDDDTTDEERAEEVKYRESRIAKENILRKAAASRVEMINKSAPAKKTTSNKKTTKSTLTTPVSEKSSTKKASIKKARKKTTRRRR